MNNKARKRQLERKLDRINRRIEGFEYEIELLNEQKADYEEKLKTLEKQSE